MFQLWIVGFLISWNIYIARYTDSSVYAYLSIYLCQLFNLSFSSFSLPCPVGWGCRIYQLHLCRGVRNHLPKKYPGYDFKQSDGEVLVMLELWGIRGTPSLPSLPRPLWPGVVVPDRVLSMGQIELNLVLMLYWIAWNCFFLKNGFGII